MSDSGISEEVLAFWRGFMPYMDNSPHFLANAESVEATPTRGLKLRCVNRFRGESILCDIVTNSLGRPIEQDFFTYLVGKIGDYSDGTRLGAMGNKDNGVRTSSSQ